MDLVQFFAFLKQVGLALAGAGCLWGMVFAFKGKKYPQQAKAFFWIRDNLGALITAGMVIAIVGWLGLVWLNPAAISAHEGLTIEPSHSEFIGGLKINSIFFPLLIIVFGAFAVMRLKYREVLAKQAFAWYAVMFSLIFLAISFPAWTGEAGRAQFFYAGHSFHSIFTVGTVLVLDSLVLLSQKSQKLKQCLYPTFPTISKVIWIGLAFDFLSVALVFREAFALTPKFYFMQTVVGILIINGAFLSGPMTKKMLDSLKKPLSRKWMNIGIASGVISVTSWLTITFTDFVKVVHVSYGQLLLIYLVFVITVYLGHFMFGSRLEEKIAKVLKVDLL